VLSDVDRRVDQEGRPRGCDLRPRKLRWARAVAAGGRRENADRARHGVTRPTTQELLTPTPVARPDRIDEPLRRSEARDDDRFDLPPS
jgi:hypothetical protein